MIGFTILLGAAGIAFGTARLVRADALPFLLGAGFALSLLPLPLERELLESAAFLGLAFLVFLAGHELNPHRLAPFGKAAVIAAVIRVLGVGTVAFALATAFGHEAWGALVLGLACGSCSPTVGVRLLEGRREFFEPAGRLAAGVLLVQGLLIIVALPLLAIPADGMGAALPGALGVAALIGASFAFMRWASLYLVTHLELDEEVILLVIFSILVAFIALARLAGLPILAGAFLAGIALSRFPVNGLIRGYMKSSSDLATAITFTALGALVIIPRGPDLALALLLIVVLLLLTPVLLTLVGGPSGPTARPAFRTGLIVSQTGELSLILALQGVTLGLVGQDAVSVVLLVTAATMLLTPALSKGNRVWNLLTRMARRHGADPEHASDHVLMLGSRGADLPLLDAIRDAGAELLVIDDDPGMVAKIRETGIRARWADASDRAVIDSAGAARAHAVVLTVSHLSAAGQALAGIEHVPTIARVHTLEAARRAEALGAIPVLWAEPIAKDFLAWLADVPEP
jgi:Kef-type K+ transport system membrane component KefB